MASSIESEFNPPDDLSRDEVIQMARHYINYWKIECNSYVHKYMESLNHLYKAKNRTEELWEHFKKIYKEKAEWQPIETAPKDEYILISFYYTEDKNERWSKITYWSDSEKGWDGLAHSVRIGETIVTHWMPLPKLPTQNCVE